MAISEGSMHVYVMYKDVIATPFGNRVMEEIGNIKHLERNEIKNYILTPMRAPFNQPVPQRLEDLQEVTTAWVLEEFTGKMRAMLLEEYEDQELVAELARRRGDA